MPIATHIPETGNEVVIRVSGRFDFSLHREFRQAYEEARKRVAGPRFTIDLGNAEYMDSSALGMLLLLREHSGGDKSGISITGCRPAIRSILEIANFHKMFRIA